MPISPRDGILVTSYTDSEIYRAEDITQYAPEEMKHLYAGLRKHIMDELGNVFMAYSEWLTYPDVDEQLSCEIGQGG